MGASAAGAAAAGSPSARTTSLEPLVLLVGIKTMQLLAFVVVEVTFGATISPEADAMLHVAMFVSQQAKCVFSQMNQLEAKPV